MADDPTTYLDIEVGLKSSPEPQRITILDGRDRMGQDQACIKVLVHHSDDLTEELLVAQDNVAYVRTMKRVERPERRVEDGVVSLGDTPQPT